jgi:drug/metabolite transporter (DMT)-like permease
LKPLQSLPESQQYWIGAGLAALTASLWGFLGFVLKAAFEYQDAQTISWFRFLFAFLFLASFLSLRHSTSRLVREIKKMPWWMAVAALGLTLNYVLYALGVQYTSPGHAQLLSQLGPVFVMLLSPWFFNEALSSSQKFGISLSLIGFSFFYWSQLQIQNKATLDHFYWGNFLILLGSISWATWAILQKQATKSAKDPQYLNVFVFMVAALLLALTADFKSFFDLDRYAWLLLMILGANTVIAYMALSYSLKFAPAAIVHLIVSTNPLIAMFIDWERVNLWSWLASGCVLTGVLLGVLKK